MVGAFNTLKGNQTLGPDASYCYFNQPYIEITQSTTAARTATPRVLQHAVDCHKRRAGSGWGLRRILRWYTQGAELR